MSVKDTINAFFAKLPFKALAEKIPAAARAKVPLLDKAIPFANQIACGLLAVALVTAFACSGKGGSGGGSGRESPASDFTYDLTADSKGISIRKYIGSATKIVVPAKIEDMPVLSIGESAFAWKKDINSVVIPNTVIAIFNDAFAECTGITSFVIPDSVKVIGDSAFRETGMTSIVVPNSVETIGQVAFNDMPNLTKATLPDGLKVLPVNIFAGCKKLTSVNLPASIETIGSRAFADCRELTDLVIPDSLTKVTFYDTIFNSTTNSYGDTISSFTSSFTNCGKLPIKTRRRLQELGYLGKF